MRRLAIVLGISRTTVERKLRFLAQHARDEFESDLKKHPPVSAVEFDDMETFEHTKCKPLSITVMVEHKTRRLLGIGVAEMPCNGLLAKISRKKYGKRFDQRAKVRRHLFKNVQPFVALGAEIRSDQNPHYGRDVREFFPSSVHKTFKGRKPAAVGQGELKKGIHDPLFSLNHTAACFRDSVKRLARKTWCTTKNKERLKDHLILYALFHNRIMLKNPT